MCHGGSLHGGRLTGHDIKGTRKLHWRNHQAIQTLKSCLENRRLDLLDRVQEVQQVQAKVSDPPHRLVEFYPSFGSKKSWGVGGWGSGWSWKTEIIYIYIYVCTKIPLSGRGMGHMKLFFCCCCCFVFCLFGKILISQYQRSFKRTSWHFPSSSFFLKKPWRIWQRISLVGSDMAHQKIHNFWPYITYTWSRYMVVYLFFRYSPQVKIHHFPFEDSCFFG